MLLFFITDCPIYCNPGIPSRFSPEIPRLTVRNSSIIDYCRINCFILLSLGLRLAWNLWRVKCFHFNETTCRPGSVQESPPNGGGSAKRDVTHPTATVVYNVSYHLFRKRSFTTVHRLACTRAGVVLLLRSTAPMHSCFT